MIKYEALCKENKVMITKQIISASRRTDIPAFYGTWFQEKIEQGFCEIANPFNPQQISKISLQPKDVLAFIFWTRNPAPFFKILDFLDKQDFKYGFLFTLNNYPKFLELNNPNLDKALKSFENISLRIGSDKIIWRYDPIIISDKTNFSWHLQNFEFLAKRISGLSNKIIMSFLDMYRKTKNNLKKLGLKINENIRDVEETKNFLSDLFQIAKKNKLEIQACCEVSQILKNSGIKSGGCISKEFVENITKEKMEIKRHSKQRKFFRCVQSKDIGSYETCRHGCLYCYATTKHVQEK